jgi:hypothetical protein
MTTGDFVMSYASNASDAAATAGYTSQKDARLSSSLKSTGLNVLPRTPLIIVLTQKQMHPLQQTLLVHQHTEQMKWSTGSINNCYRHVPKINIKKKKE